MRGIATIIAGLGLMLSGCGPTASTPESASPVRTTKSGPARKGSMLGAPKGRGGGMMGGPAPTDALKGGGRGRGGAGELKARKEEDGTGQETSGSSKTQGDPK